MDGLPAIKHNFSGKPVTVVIKIKYDIIKLFRVSIYFIFFWLEINNTVVEGRNESYLPKIL